jgi:hypothetical protein
MGPRYYVSDVANQRCLPGLQQLTIRNLLPGMAPRKPGKASFPAITAIFIGTSIALILPCPICRQSVRNGCVLITRISFWYVHELASYSLTMSLTESSASQAAYTAIESTVCRGHKKRTIQQRQYRDRTIRSPICQSR